MRSSADFASRACGSRLNPASENLCKARDADLKITHGDALEKLRELPTESVHCCVTSPPFWGLRDYGTASWEGGDVECDHVGRSQTSDASTLNEWKNGGGQRYKEASGGMPFAYDCGKCGAKRIDSQLGLEKTPEEYVAKMVEVFSEVRRVLRKDGTLWLNLGDSYAAKDLCGIPWRVAFALQADGWYLRQDIIWAKPNPMPESVTDRCTKAHEYLFLLTKSARYFYDADAIKDPNSPASRPGRKDGQDSPVRGMLIGKANNNGQGGLGACNNHVNGRNKRSVWTVATAPYPEAHFATYPPDLIKPCILAGTSAKGCCAKCGAPWERVTESSKSFELTDTIPCTVLDPFAGSGTTGAVALELGRRAILIELNTKYIELIHRRCTTITPGFAFA